MGADLPWPDRYRPQSCSALLADSAAVERVRGWLAQWKPVAAQTGSRSSATTPDAVDVRRAPPGSSDGMFQEN